MKRFSALLLALVLIVLAIPFAGVSAAENKFLWVTHYNDVYAEGSGVIFTRPYSDCVWHDHYAFAPVVGKENVFELVNTSFGVGTGAGKALAVPAGGFVYVLNSGNDYPALYASDPVGNGWCNGKPNYTNEYVDAAITEAKTWAIGDKFVFNGLDLAAFTLPTSTPEIKWYEDGYVCTATYAAYDENAVASQPDETSDPAESSEVSEKTSSVAESSEADNDEGGNLEVILWVVASVAVIAVVAVVVVVVLKKKK